MIRVTKLGLGTERYYLEPARSGWEAPGRWVGAGAAALGLAGRVEAGQLRSALELVHPTSGTALRRPSPIRAYDLTVSDPKSVSVAWALGTPETAAAVLAARDASLSATIGYLEARACQTKHGSASTGLVGAAFVHRTSRAGDPHLHTHLLVMNLAGPVGPDQWAALDGLVLVAQARTAGHLYQADLRHQISGRLGLEWDEVRYGVAQLSSVSPELRTLFSQRRAQVEAGMALHHGASPASARLAALVDRPERVGERSAPTMAPEWRRRAREAGLMPDGAGARMPTGPAGPTRPTPAGPDPSDLGLDRMSSFSRAELLEALTGAARPGAPLARVEAEADRMLASPQMERITGRAPLRRRDVMRRPGVTVPIPTEEGRWRTAAAGRAEESLARVAARRMDAAAGLAPSSPFTRGLDEEAARAVESLTRSGAGVELVGGSGARLEGVLHSAHRAWTSAGHRVVVAAPESAERAQAGNAGFAVTDTGRLDEGLARLRRPMPDTVIVLLGAESTPAPVLARLAESTERTGAKLVLVGDPGPLRDVDRAGGWRSAEAAVGARVLTRGLPLRQLEPGQPEIVAGRVTPWLVIAPTPGAVRDRLVSDWRSEGPAAVMVASHRADIEDLNDRARRLLTGRGELGERLAVPSRPPARAGERLVVGGAGPAARQLGLRPGTLITARVGGLELDGGEKLGPVLPADLDLRYAYACTPYQAWRSGAASLLVLGPPPPGARRPDGRIAYYTVGPERAAMETVGPERAAMETVGPERAWAALAHLDRRQQELSGPAPKLGRQSRGRGRERG